MIKKSPKQPLSVWRPTNLETFLYGSPHYPEHIEEAAWERDAQRMREAGFNVVRMGEFAWHLFEPRENHFEFGLFDRAIEVLAKHGIKTIMCTPTATPPRWLTMHYPEVLRVDGNGRLASHGSRQHADTSNPVYRQHSQRITTAMAVHYQDNPNVVGWQTDNELNTSESRSYAPATRREFQKFLEDKYGAIEALNHAWGGNFWATAYDNFDQVVLPFDRAPCFLGPSHVQDYHRFLAFATARFQHDQVQILRAANPDWFIFHNLGALADIDFRGQFSEDLDFAGYDIYPFLYDEIQRNGGAAYAQALHLDICRGFSGNFIVPEQQSGFGAQPVFSTLAPEPGEMRRMAYSSIAHGADGVMFFRWRPAHFGAEIYWMGIIDHDDVPRRRFAEAKQIGEEVKKLSSDVLGTAVRMDVGIAGADFDNQEAHRAYPIGLPSPEDEAILLHRYCYERGIACGFIHPEDDLSKIKLFYVPHWVIWNDKWTDRIRAFAENGGTVVLSARTGSRDENNHIIKQAAPGVSLSALTGIKVQEFGRLAPLEESGLFANGGLRGDIVRKQFPAESAARHYKFKIGNHEVTAAHMYELLELNDGTEARGVWSNRFADGTPAISVRKVGKGRLLYSGTYLTDALVDTLIADEFEKAGIEPILKDKPSGIEVTIREADDRKLMFVLNTAHEVQTVRNLPAGTALVGPKLVDGTVELPAFGCLVLKLNIT